MKKLNYNAVYISFSVYNINVNIYYINAFLYCNDVSIILKC